MKKKKQLWHFESDTEVNCLTFTGELAKQHKKTLSEKTQCFY